MDDYLTVKEVATACDVSLRTVRRWLANKELEGAFQDPEGERRWHVPPLAIIDRLPSEADKDGTSPKKRGSLQHQLTETRHALDLEVNRRIAAERLADERKERIDEQVKAISFYQAALEAPRAEAPPAKPKKRTGKTLQELLDDETDVDPKVEVLVDSKYDQIDRSKDSASKKKWWKR